MFGLFVEDRELICMLLFYYFFFEYCVVFGLFSFIFSKNFLGKVLKGDGYFVFLFLLFFGFDMVFFLL